MHVFRLPTLLNELQMEGWRVAYFYLIAGVGGLLLYFTMRELEGCLFLFDDFSMFIVACRAIRKPCGYRATGGEGERGEGGEKGMWTSYRQL